MFVPKAGLSGQALVLAGILTVSIPMAALAQSAPPSAYQLGRPLYIDIKGGAAFPTAQSSSGFRFAPDTGFNVGLAVGYRFSNNLRADLEFSYFNSNVPGTRGFVFGSLGFTSGPPVFAPLSPITTNSKAENFAGLVNLYYDFDTGSAIRPYLGVGIGYSSFNYTGSGSFSQGLFAYQARAGVNFGLSPELELLLGYRFFGTTSITFPAAATGFGTAIDVGGQAIHNVELGLRFIL